MRRGAGARVDSADSLGRRVVNNAVVSPAVAVQGVADSADHQESLRMMQVWPSAEPPDLSRFIGVSLEMAGKEAAGCRQLSDALPSLPEFLPRKAIVPSQ